MINVLVVDDDPSIGRLLHLILSLEGIGVAQAHSGEAAINYLEKVAAHPDFILLDIAMPGMDGLAVYKEARRAGIGCPIVFCSSYGAEKANRELGAQGAIRKPFHPAEVVSLVRSLTGTVQAG